MKTKCLICGKKNKESFVSVTEWIIDPPKEATTGKKDMSIHTSCLDNKLYIERPDGFVYGRINIHKPKKKKGNKND